MIDIVERLRTSDDENTDAMWLKSDRNEAADEIESLRQQLAEYEGVEGRCKRGHNKKFSYHLLGKDGCVACEGEDALQQLAECQARDHAPAAVIRSVTDTEVRIKWLLGFPQIGTKLYLAMPSDSTLKQAKREMLLEAANKAKPYSYRLSSEFERMAKELE